MTILITGGGGQLGSELKELSKQYPKTTFVFTDYPETDLTINDQVQALFDLHNPGYCINTAAYTAVDQAESDKENALALNAKSLAYLTEACKKHGTKLVHVSTDFVFNGQGNAPLAEDMPTAPVNYYGESKLEGEKILTGEYAEDSMIIRTSWLYSSFQKNFVKTMLFLGRNKEQLKVIFDQAGTPTYARDLAEAILTIIHDKDWHPGIYHYSNEGVASWYDFAMAIFQEKNISIPVEPVTTDAFPTPANRPAYSVMSKKKIRNTFSLPIRHWREALKDCLELLD